MDIPANIIDPILEALSEVQQGAVKINRQDSRITNYSINRCKEAYTGLLDYICFTQTAFKTFEDLLNAKGGYRPSIPVGHEWGRVLANAYDEAQEKRGDYRRAYRS